MLLESIWESITSLSMGSIYWTLIFIIITIINNDITAIIFIISIVIISTTINFSFFNYFYFASLGFLNDFCSLIVVLT